MRDICLSYLTNVYHSRKRGLTVLHQSEVTDWAVTTTFADAVADIIKKAAYPARQSNKLESYGWTPALFMPSRDADGREGVWRIGEHASEHLSMFVADLDNQHADRPMVSLNELHRYLTLQLGLTHWLYTSFSHTPERHKVRIVCPTTRDLTPAEAYEIFEVLNADLEGQLDGSIYDPGDFLYGPPHRPEYRFGDGAPLDVDAYLAKAAAMAPEKRTPRVSHAKAITLASRSQTAALWADVTATDGLSIYSPEHFPTEWLTDLHSRYRGGSRHQSMMGLLTRAWLRSRRTLSRHDLQTLQREIDGEYGGYLMRTYGAAILEDDLRAVMRVVGEPNQNKQTDCEARVARNLKRLRKNK